MNSKYAAVIPYLVVKNAKDSIEFYQKAFGFELLEPPTEHEGKIVHVEMHFEGAKVFFAPEEAYGGKSKAPATSGVTCPVSFMLECSNVDALHDQAQKNGAKITRALENTFWGQRFFMAEDINGYEWGFGQPL